MASKKKTTVPSRTQAKVRTIQSIRKETPEQLRRREYLEFEIVEDGLNTIRAISDVLGYVGEKCQGNGEENRLPTIAAGLCEALEVVHRRMASEIAVRP